MSEFSARRLLSSALVVVLCTTQTVVQAASDSWHLKQYSKIQGEQEIWLSPHTIKIVNTTKKLTIMLNLHDVFIWNDAEKMIYKMPLSNWQGLHRVAQEDAVAAEFGGIVMGGIKNGELFGLPTQKIYYPSKRSIAAHDPAPRATLWTSKAFHLPTELSHAIQYYYALPAFDGFPLQCYRFSPVDGNSYRLRTNLLERIADSRDRFKTPANYRSANNESQILYGNKSVDMIKTMTSD